MDVNFTATLQPQEAAALRHSLRRQEKYLETKAQGLMDALAKVQVAADEYGDLLALQAGYKLRAAELGCTRAARAAVREQVKAQDGADTVELQLTAAPDVVQALCRAPERSFRYLMGKATAAAMNLDSQAGPALYEEAALLAQVVHAFHVTDGADEPEEEEVDEEAAE